MLKVGMTKKINTWPMEFMSICNRMRNKYDVKYIYQNDEHNCQAINLVLQQRKRNTYQKCEEICKAVK